MLNNFSAAIEISISFLLLVWATLFSLLDLRDVFHNGSVDSIARDKDRKDNPTEKKHRWSIKLIVNKSTEKNKQYQRDDNGESEVPSEFQNGEIYFGWLSFFIHGSSLFLLGLLLLGLWCPLGFLFWIGSSLVFLFRSSGGFAFCCFHFFLFLLHAFNFVNFLFNFLI